VKWYQRLQRGNRECGSAGGWGYLSYFDSLFSSSFRFFLQ
jgi:hypothetical protein